MIDIDTDARPSKMSDADLAAHVAGEVEKNGHAQGEWREEARTAYDFVAGHQWSVDDLAVLEEQRRPAVVFNRTGPMVAAVHGAQVNNRQEIKILARSGDDGAVAEIRDLVLKWVRDQTDAEDEESEAFRDAAVCGVGVIHTYIDTMDDPTGVVKMERVDVAGEMGWDRAATKKDLSDAKHFHRRRHMDRAYVMARWPEFGELVAGVPPDVQGAHRNVRGDQYQSRGEDVSWPLEGVLVTHFQWCEVVCSYHVKNPVLGGVEVLDEAQWEAVKERIGAEAVEVFDYAKRLENAWWECFECGGVVADRALCPDPRSASYKVMTGQWDRRRRMFYGLVRAVMDPQRWANKWLSQSMHILNTSAKSGLVVEESAVKDIRKFEEEWAKAGSVSVVRDGGLSRLREKVAASFPAGFGELLQFAIASTNEVTGINKEMLGTVGHEQAGVLEAQRKQAAQAVLAPLFDSLRRYYKSQGRLLMEMVRRYLPAERIARIALPDGQPRAIPLAVLHETTEYDVIVDQAPMSPNQKTEVWQVLQPTLPALVKMGMPLPVWTELLRYSPLPDSAVTKIVEGLKNQPPPALDPAVIKAKLDAEARQQETALKAQEMQAEIAMREREMQAELAMTAQKHAMEMEQEQARAALDYEIARQKGQLDLALSAGKAGQQRELEEYKARVAADVSREKLEGDRNSAAEAIQASVEPLVATLRGMVGAMASLERAQAATAGRLAEALGEVGMLIRAPRRAVRDANGRVSGSEIVLQ